MRKSTKILIIVYIVFLVPSLVLGNSILEGIKPTESGFVFNFDVKGIIAIVLTIISIVLGMILYYRFLLSLSMDKMLFFSTVPLMLIYGVSLFMLAEVSLFNNNTANSFRSLLNISSDNAYNTILWAVLISLIFALIMFVNYLIICKPVSKVEKIVLRLGDGKVKTERLNVGKGKQFNAIEHGLNKINNNYKAKDNSLKKVDLETKKFIPKQFFRFLGKGSIAELELGNQVKKQATTMNIKLIGLTNVEQMTLEDNFQLINSYLNIIAPHIRKCGGFIDKYLGDGVLAVFGKSDDAIKCSHIIARAIDVKNRQNKTLPNISLRLSMMSGEVIFGVVGEEERKIPTIVSDEISTLEKINEICRYMSAKIVFTKSVIDELPLQFKFNYRYIGSLSIGENKTIMLFEDLDVYPRNVLAGLVRYREMFERGVISYNNESYKESYNLFMQILKYIPQDKASYVYFNKSKEKLSE